MPKVVASSTGSAYSQVSTIVRLWLLLPERKSGVFLMGLKQINRCSAHCKSRIALQAISALTLIAIGSLPAHAIVRVWVASDGTWNAANTSNWSPNGIPGLVDATQLGVGLGTFETQSHNAIIELSFPNAEATVENVGVGQGIDLLIGDEANNSNDLLHAVDFAGMSTDAGLWIRGSASPEMNRSPNTLKTGRLGLSSGSFLAMRGGRVEILGESGIDAKLEIKEGTSITGWGTLDLETSVDSGTLDDTLFENLGTLTVGDFGVAPSADSVAGDPVARQLTINVPSPNAFVSLGSSSGDVVNIQRNATLDVNGRMLSFIGTMNLSANSKIDVAGNWGTTSNAININSGATNIGGIALPASPARIAGGRLQQNTGAIILDQADESLIFDAPFKQIFVGAIENSGTITFNNITELSGQFQMNGPNASLVVNAPVTIDQPDFNLDGDGNANNILTIGDNGYLDLNLGTGGDTTLNGTVVLGGGVLDIDTPADFFALGPNRTVLAVEGTNTSRIRGPGEVFTVNGQLKIEADAKLVVSPDSGVVFSGSSQISIDATGELDLDGDTVSYNSSDSTFSGDGILRPGNATYNADTTFNIASIVLDDGRQTLASGSDLTINANAISLTANDGFDNTMSISDESRLTVNIAEGDSWDMEGTIHYHGDATFSTFLAGSTVDLEGAMNIAGKAVTATQIRNEAEGTINLPTTNDGLRLGSSADLNIAGGQVIGDGQLSSSGGDITGFGTVATEVDFFGINSNIRAANGGTLTLSGDILDVWTLGTASESSTLQVVKPWNSSVALRVELNGGRLTGGTITNDNTAGMRGFGLVAARVINNTRIEAATGGTLVLETALNNNDWDGASETGVLAAIGGNLTLRDNATFDFDGHVQVENGHTVFADGFELEFDNASRLTINSGTYRSTESTHFAGSIDVGAGPAASLQIEGTAFLETTSSTTLDGDLQLDNPGTLILAGAEFSGAGQLVNLTARGLQLANGADVGVGLVNQGEIELAGIGIGSATVAAFQQTSEGAINIDVDGLASGEFDSLSVDGIVDLAGELDLFLGGAYVPELGDTIDILTGSSVVGRFDSIDQSPGMPSGLFFDVVYTSSLVQLMVVDSLPDADVDDDGDVDGADFLLIQRTNASLIPLWESQYGSESALASSQSVPEPTAIACAVIGVVLSLSRRNLISPVRT